jgi:hypothetical protein
MSDINANKDTPFSQVVSYLREKGIEARHADGCLYIATEDKEYMIYPEYGERLCCEILP